MAAAKKTKKPSKAKSTPKTTDGQGTLEYLQRAVDDIDKARRHAISDVRAAVDAAVERVSAAAGDVRRRAEEEADELRRRAENRTGDWQKTLEEATEDVRRDLARRAVQAQQTPDALTELSAEIRRRRAQLRQQQAGE